MTAMEPTPPTLLPGQSARVMIGYLDGRTPTEVFATDDLLLEAPNWTLDSTWLVLNGAGRLWRLPADGGSGIEEIPLSDVPALNNDHVLAPDGERIYVSANDWHIYEASLLGGAARRITDVDPSGRMHFLHGVSPEDTQLAYIGVVPHDGNWSADAHVFLMPTAGGPSVQLTRGTGPDDGSEFSPDSRWIYFNTESFSDIAGHAQIARVPVQGGEPEQLTFDGRVNWFPHLSPDRAYAVYLSYPPGTTGHPANLDVHLRVIRLPDWTAHVQVIEVFGGQGTLNVNSWAPDGERFAYVSYPLSSP